MIQAQKTKGMVCDMKKTLYSLMLDDEVVREVDALAHQLGTNRSNLINQIIAEYVNYTTPGGSTTYSPPSRSC